MIKTFYNQNDRQFAPKTAHQMFRRIDIAQSQESRNTKTSKQRRNLPFLDHASSKKIIHVGKSLDNSKQNLMFQGFLQKVNSASKIDEKSVVSNYLNSLRKDYDKMHKQTKQHMSSIILKKKDIQFIKERVKIHQTSVQSLQQKIQLKMSQMQRIAQKQLQVQTQRKSLDYIIFRMKKDQIFYKQFDRVSEGQISQNKKVVKALKENILHEDQKIHKLIVNFEGIKRQFDKNQQFRSRKFEDYCQKLQNIHQKQAFIQERKQRTLQLQSIQSNDILKARNLQIRNICLINQVANCLFENKIQHLIGKYSDIQKAFHTIQVKTSISDPTLLASKFFSYEGLTQNLLKSISHLERQLQERTRRNQELKEQFRRAEDKKYSSDVLEVQKVRERKLTAQQIDGLNQKQLQYHRITQWIERQVKRLNILTGQGSDSDVDGLVNKFYQVCLKTKTQTQEIAKTFTQHQKYVTPGIRIKKIIKEANQDFRNQKTLENLQIQGQNSTENEFLNIARAGVKRNFNIKRKTINTGTLTCIKQSKNETLSSDRKVRASDNH